MPLTDDETWQRLLGNLPPVSLPGQVLMVVPHPDDETLGAGALIAALCGQGAPVTVIAVTDGENAYETSKVEREQLGRLREREQLEALWELGVSPEDVCRLRLEDSGLQPLEDVLVRSLLAAIVPGTTILAPWSGDFHPDHEVCARAAARAASLRAVPLLSYFFWTWHRGTPGLLADLPLQSFRPACEALEAKARAIAKHRSQLHRDAGEPILSHRLLAPARWPFEVFLAQ